MLELWTIQIGKWRLAKEQGIHFLDITVKSGLQCFAPYPAVLWDYKGGKISWDEYVVQFHEKMEQSRLEFPKHWDRFAEKEKVALACYCGANENCHRKLLAPLIVKHLKGLQDPPMVLFQGELQ